MTNNAVLFFTLFALSACAIGRAETTIHYSVEYAAFNGSRVHIALKPSKAVLSPVSFVMPRNYPGGYSLVPYDAFVQDLRATSANGNTVAVTKQEFGPRWRIGDSGDAVAIIDYWVDLGRMEADLHSAVDSSKVRSGYLGILGYSVFGYVEGFEDQQIDLQVEVRDWPILTTLSPSVPAAIAKASAYAPNYYALADSQILAGPDLHLRSLPGKIPLILAVYAEGEDDLNLEGQIAREALDKVQLYFGDAPFPQYTVQLELLRPLPHHEYDFSQEHLSSGTFSFSTAAAVTRQSVAARRQVALFNYAHHIAHCWIPKRAYGVGYLPFSWEMPPVIDTIWFNEGFGRYAAIQALADEMPAAEGTEFRTRQLANLRKVLNDAPAFIRQMPLLVLSREASFMYSLDFRIGRNTFARGSLMAAEMDERIRAHTEGKKSLRDALRFVLHWTQQNHRAFQVEELPKIFADATGVEVRDILEQWTNER